MVAEWLFVQTVEDIRRRSSLVDDGDRYSLLGIAPLLRKVLTDGRALVDTVSVVRPEVDISFQIVPFSDPREDPTDPGWGRIKTVVAFGRDELVPAVPVTPLGLEEFLQTQVGVVEGLPMSVGSTIRYFSHVEGGVHFGVPKTLPERVLANVTPSFFGYGSVWTDVLGRIGAIAADGLRPLADAILAAPTDNQQIQPRNEAGPLDNHWARQAD